MLKMTIDNEEVLSDNDISIKEEILSPSSTILNNVYPKSWELDKDYTSRFYYPKDYSKLNIQNFSIEPEEAGKTIQVNGSATLTDVDTSKESRVLRILGQTSQTGTPTPSSPIPVNVVSGDNSINVCGKNLIPTSDIISASGTISNGITFTRNGDGSITANGTATSGISIYINADYTELPAGTYTFSDSVPSGGSGTTFFLYVDVKHVDGTSWDIKNFSTAETTTRTRTMGEPFIFKTRIVIRNGQTLNNVVFKPMLEKGSTATTYEPYIGNTYPIYLGGNVFKLSEIEENKAIVGATGVITNSSVSNLSGYVPVIENLTYRLTFDYVTLLNSSDRGICYYDKNKTFISGGNLPMTNKNQIITIPSGIRYVRFGYDKNLTNINFTTDTTPIELCKIGTYQDYIYKDNGSWYLHKEIGKVVLDGTETGWGMSAWGTSPYKRMSRDLADIKQVPDSEFTQIYSNEFRAGKYNDGSLNTITSRGSLHQLNLWQDVATTNLNAWLTWLASNNLIVYYQLATPTNTEITDTTLLEQLESLSS